MDLVGVCNSFFALCIILFPYCCIAENNVPIIAWTNLKYLNSVPSMPVGHVTEENVLMSNVIDKIFQNNDNEVVFLFIYDKLSIDDISKYGNSNLPNNEGGNLQYLKASLDQASSQLILPLVEPVALNAIKDRAVGSVFMYDGSNGWTTKLAKDRQILLIVPLHSSADRASSLTTSDIIMETILDRAIDLNIQYTAIFTASEPSKYPTPRDDGTLLHIGRSLLAMGDAKNATYNFVNYTAEKGGCNVILYIQNITVNTTSKAYHIPPSQSWDTDKSVCTNGQNIILTMSYGTELDDFTDFSMTFAFVIGNETWRMLENNVNYTLNGEEPTLIRFNISMLDPHRNFSYHCGDLNFKNESSTVILYDFQVQPADVVNGTFSRATDCVNFFTPSIWMGLVTTLILVSILYFGVSMLTSLTVMDQFDDPKGKTITVNVSD